MCIVKLTFAKNWDMIRSANAKKENCSGGIGMDEKLFCIDANSIVTIFTNSIETLPLGRCGHRQRINEAMCNTSEKCIHMLD